MTPEELKQQAVEDLETRIKWNKEGIERAIKQIAKDEMRLMQLREGKIDPMKVKCRCSGWNHQEGCRYWELPF